ncbi:MAG: archaellin/type IV pilin N-terminal domain-containing protein [Candidatus Nanohaloarchaea archaeon]
MISRKKGVTPVVATALLIGISVSASYAAYSFLSGTQGDVREGYEKKFQREELVEKTRIDIETIYNSSNHWAFVRIRNTGSRDIRINSTDKPEEVYWSMYVDEKPVGNPEGTGWKFWNNEKAELSPQETITLNSTSRFPESSAKEFRVTARYEAESVSLCRPAEGSPC